jgi:hypothetical protein
MQWEKRQNDSMVDTSFLSGQLFHFHVDEDARIGAIDVGIEKDEPH